MRREANIRMADNEAHRDLKQNKRRLEVGCYIDDRDGNVDSNQQDIDDSGVGNGAWEEEAEDLKRAVRKKKTEDDHRRHINDHIVLGTRLGGTEAEKKTKRNLGRDKKYKDGGAGLSKTVKDGGAEPGETVKDEGTSQGQDTGDIDGSCYYPLVGPRPEEAPRHRHQHSSAVHRCRAFPSTPSRCDE